MYHLQNTVDIFPPKPNINFSWPLPTCVFGTRFAGLIFYVIDLHSVHVNSADLHVDLLLSELCKTAKDVKIPKHLPPDFTFLQGYSKLLYEINQCIIDYS